MLNTSKDHTGSVTRLWPPSSSPGWYKYQTFTREGSFFLFTPMGLEQGVEGLATTAFSLIAKASYLPVRLVTLFFNAEKTLDSRATHAVDRLPAGSCISAC